MSDEKDDEKGFLARWSQRKRDAGKPEPKDAVEEKPEQAIELRAVGEVEPVFDLESLPKLEELTKDTDMTVFFRKGVPESIRNAALRKSWALDPAIRNYVNPALDYAYDWNTPGGVPGAGELAPSTDIARMVSQVFGELPKAVGGADQNEEAADDATAVRQPDTPTQSIRLSEADAPTSFDAERGIEADAAPQQTTDSSEDAYDSSEDAYGERRSFASQQEPRKHGSARPK